MQVTIEQEMRKEAIYLRKLRVARERVKEVIEGPGADIDRMIRSVRDNGGRVSNKLIGEFHALADPGLARAVAEAVESAFMPAGSSQAR